MWSTEDYVFLEGEIPRTPILAKFNLSRGRTLDRLLSSSDIDDYLSNNPELIVSEIHTTGSITFSLALGALLSMEAFSQVNAKDVINIAYSYLKDLLGLGVERRVLDKDTLRLLAKYNTVKIEITNKDGSSAKFDLKKD